MLANVEDDWDVEATHRARDEVMAEMAEFDETFTSQAQAAVGSGEVRATTPHT